MQIMVRRQAIERGLVKYFTGKPCKHGHIVERYTVGGACTECVAERMRQEREFIKRRRAEVEAGEVVPHG